MIHHNFTSEIQRVSKLKSWHEQSATIHTIIPTLQLHKLQIMIGDVNSKANACRERP
jgi:hypothetical protein